MSCTYRFLPEHVLYAAFGLAFCFLFLGGMLLVWALRRSRAERPSAIHGAAGLAIAFVVLSAISVMVSCLLAEIHRRSGLSPSDLWLGASVCAGTTMALINLLLGHIARESEQRWMAARLLPYLTLASTFCIGAAALIGQ